MKTNILITTLVIGMTASGLASAGEMKGGMTGGRVMKGMMGEKMMGKGMMGMHGMMGKASMVATKDGGVIVLKGNTLYKFDKNLNLVKEAALKADEMDMSEMKKMCTTCPMHSKMMGKDEAGEAQTEESAPKDKTEHESHH